MILSFALALALSPAPTASAQGATNSAEQKEANPAPQLTFLDQTLTRTQKEKGDGRIDENQYQEFLIKFRSDLEATIARVEPTPVNSALHARLLSRLGDSNQAFVALSPSLERDPDNPTLRVGLGHIHFDRKDYTSALAEAEAVLKRDPKNKDALALKYSSAGRIAPGSAPSSAITPGPPDGKGVASATKQFRAPRAQDSAKVQALVPRIQDAHGSGDMRTAISLSQELMRIEPTSEYAQEIYRIVAKDYTNWQQTERVKEATSHIFNAKAALKAGRGDDALAWAGKAVRANPDPVTQEFENKVREIVGDSGAGKKSSTPKDGGVPLWPMIPAFGLGAAFAVTKSRTTVESEDGYNENDRPQPGQLQRFVAGAILSGLAGAGLYFGGAYAISAAAPAAARFLSGPGQQAVRLAQSEVGAINPNSINSAQTATKTAIWSSGKIGDPVKNALGHWNKHNREFPEFRNAKEYVEGAWKFIRNPPPGTLSKPSSVKAGETIIYNPTSNTLLFRGADGAPKSMYRPDTAIHKFATNLDYYHAQ